MNRRLPNSDLPPNHRIRTSRLAAVSSLPNHFASPQFRAAIWLALAWMVGTVLFELPEPGGEADEGQFETRDPSLHSRNHNRPLAAEVDSDRDSLTLSPSDGGVATSVR